MTSETTMTHTLPATRAAATAALERFAPRAGRQYAARRNYDNGAGRHDNVSCLSPYLRHRLLLESEVLRAVLDQHPWPAPEKFVQEVYWRAYFKGWLEHRPQVWRDYLRDLGGLAEDLDRQRSLRERYAQAVEGRTGIDAFDAWACELRDTGYLHNHARMWFASIWIFTLDLPWQLGADFFLQHLLDGDPASNTLSWRWVGGLHTRGKTYLARPDNIARYTQGRFDNHGQLAAHADPLFEERDYPVYPLPQDPAFAFDAPYALLITAEDCAPESLGLGTAPASLVALTATPPASPLGTSDGPRAFAASAVADAARRAEAHFAVDCHRVERDDELSAALRARDVQHVVTAYAPTGPLADRLAALERELAVDGVSLHRVRRPYDGASWPHATRGFFKLKKAIPALLRDLT
ncbi:MAG: FAD-binding domain-containing protein [Pseudomonadota bacterium]